MKSRIFSERRFAEYAGPPALDNFPTVPERPNGSLPKQFQHFRTVDVRGRMCPDFLYPCIFKPHRCRTSSICDALLDGRACCSLVVVDVRVLNVWGRGIGNKVQCVPG